MRFGRQAQFESLERRLALTVSATVSAAGDLLVTGDADGAVEIVAVGDGAFQVSDNGVVVADASVLQGVTDDLRITLEESAAGNNDTVTVTLGEQAVDAVYARLGDGDNVFEVSGGSLNSLNYRGGDGVDTVTLASTIASTAKVDLGDGDNVLNVNADVGRLAVHAGDGNDVVTIAAEATVDKSALVNLGDGDNSFTLAGSIDGRLEVSGRNGDDAVTLAAGSVADDSVRLTLGEGDNSVTLAGTIGGSFFLSGRDGNDTLTVADTSDIAKDLAARLGDGQNTATVAGSVGGNVSIVSANEDDVIDVAAAVIGGETTLGPGEQQDLFGIGGGCGGHLVEGMAHFGGRGPGEWYRGFRR